MRPAPILMYHWFRPAGRRSTSRAPQLEITPERFASQIGWLRAQGYRTIQLRDLVGEPPGTGWPARPVVLTFDDGTLDFWQHARPVLEQNGFSATLFVVTDFVGQTSAWDRDLGEPARPLLAWEQIAELHRAGFEIGSHSRTHRPFTGLDAAEVRAEAALSREALRERLGVAPDFLAYPRGLYTDEHQRIVRECGYAGACAVVLGWRDLRRSGRYALQRVTVKGNESLLRFRLRLGVAQRIRIAAG